MRTSTLLNITPVKMFGTKTRVQRGTFQKTPTPSTKKVTTQKKYSYTTAMHVKEDSNL